MMLLYRDSISDMEVSNPVLYQCSFHQLPWSNIPDNLS